LRNGLLVIVPQTLIIRLKSHFHSLPCGVSLIIGLNGLIWVHATTTSSTSKDSSTETAFGESKDDILASQLYSSTNDPIGNETLAAIARVAGVLRILARNGIPITDGIVAQAYESSLEVGNDSAEPKQLETIDSEAERRILDSVAASVP
jgi:exosome complex component RRP4